MTRLDLHDSEEEAMKSLIENYERDKRARDRMASEPLIRVKQINEGNDLLGEISISNREASEGTQKVIRLNRNNRIATIELKIPPGVKQGTRIRLKGCGLGNPPGDLFIIIGVDHT